ncbi:MAG: hypothetical protein ACFFDI_09825 [Promethearchaeota archaeon]
MRVWCQFGAQLAAGMGWGWYHTIFSGSSLADAQSPQFYNWTYLDILLEVVHQTGAEPILTFTGCPRSIAQDGFPHNPPQDYAVYAEVIARVVMRYSEGWPDMTGPIYSFDYVEIGNEPNFPAFWNGTRQEFLDLYSVVSQRLKQLGGSFKIGGPGLADIDLSQWTNDFLSMVLAEDLPLDFFSWHAYYDDSSLVVQAIQTGTTLLANHGFTDCECVFDEYGQSLFSDATWGSMQAAVHTTDVLIGAAHQGIDIACFAVSKDVPVPPDYFGGVFGGEANFGLLTRNPTTPKPTFHALKPFVMLASRPVLSAALKSPPVFALFPYPLTYLATQGTGQYNYTILVANHGVRTIPCRIILADAPQGTYHVETSELSNSSIDQYNGWAPPTTVESSDIIVHFPPQSVVWITIYTTGQNIHRSIYPVIQVQLLIIPLILVFGKSERRKLKRVTRFT